MKQLYFSLVIPCFNEEERLTSSLPHICMFMKGHPKSGELIFVDDGSTDRTVSLIKQHTKGMKNTRIVQLPYNQGKGAAIKKGVLSARGTYIIFTDIDLSVPLSFTADILSALKKCHVAIGVRRNKGSVIKKRQPLLREYMGRVYTYYARTILQLPHNDMTCGFKGFRKSIIKKLFEKQQVTRWSFDVELMYLVKKYNMSLSEVPIEWNNDIHSKVHMAYDAINSFIDVIKIRFRDIAGKY